MDMLIHFTEKIISDYLYLETDSDGKIVCYGSVSPGFETNKYSYGEKVNPYARAGCEAKDDDWQVICCDILHKISFG